MEHGDVNYWKGLQGKTVGEYRKRKVPLLQRLEKAEKDARAMKNKGGSKGNASCCMGPRNTGSSSMKFEKNDVVLEEEKNEGKEKSYIQMINRMDTIYMDVSTQSPERLEQLANKEL